MSKRSGWLIALSVQLGSIALGGSAFAAGFDVGTNTALANARGGTGVVSRSDPGATTFNPGRLPWARGLQILTGTNLVDLNLRFQRDTLVRATDEVVFDEVENVRGPFPVPYLAASWDLGIDNLAVGVSVSGPHAHGARCMTEIRDGECVVDYSNAARHMIVGVELLQIYFLATAAYALDLSFGKLGFGLSAGPAWQYNQLTLVVDQIGSNVGPPYIEDPDFEAAFKGMNLSDVKPFFIGGIAYESNFGLRLGVAYQSGVKWEGKGELDLTLPESIRDNATLKGKDITLRTKQAHRLTAGVGWATGEHPRFAEAPRFDVEFNFVWEDWGRVDAFETESTGALDLFEGAQVIPINPVVQPKGYQDAFAFRLGSSYAALPWLTAHAGAFIETAAQPLELTNVDFASWDRYAPSAGATVHLGKIVDLTLSYALVLSPSRTVTDGEVYQSIPLSRCTYPDYDQDACAEPGTPPGSPQNEGEWHLNYHVFGANVTGKF